MANQSDIKTFPVNISVSGLGTLGRVNVPASSKQEAIEKANQVVFNPAIYIKNLEEYTLKNFEKVAQFEDWINYELGITKVAPKFNKPNVPFEIRISILIACGLKRRNKK